MICKDSFDTLFSFHDAKSALLDCCVDALCAFRLVLPIMFMTVTLSGRVLLAGACTISRIISG
jgi:hypothetical protein